MANKCCGILYRELEPPSRDEPAATEMALTSAPAKSRAAPASREGAARLRLAIMSQAEMEEFQAAQPSAAELLKDRLPGADRLAYQPSLAELMENQPAPGDLYRDIELREES